MGIQLNLEKFVCLENALRAKEILVPCFPLWVSPFLDISELIFYYLIRSLVILNYFKKCPVSFVNIFNRKVDPNNLPAVVPESEVSSLIFLKETLI